MSGEVNPLVVLQQVKEQMEARIEEADHELERLGKRVHDMEEERLGMGHLLLQGNLRIKALESWVESICMFILRTTGGEDSDVVGAQWAEYIDALSGRFEAATVAILQDGISIQEAATVVEQFQTQVDVVHDRSRLFSGAS